MKAMAGIGVPAELPTVVTAADGVTRRRWATETSRDLTVYHDREWGTPTHDETEPFEALVLTYFENGRVTSPESDQLPWRCGTPAFD